MIVKILQSSQSPRGLPTIISNFAQYSPILMSNIAIMIHSFDWFDAGFLEGMLSPRGYILAAQKVRIVIFVLFPLKQQFQHSNCNNALSPFYFILLFKTD